ncbi:hypothetical protein V7112_22125 [Bacillus sp. JJ1566]|uniref:hypothetical protein n=1 Tax=Bacillus sp. JJ1566 TaxID=3122961 RepID=UPI002FFDF39F
MEIKKLEHINVRDIWKSEPRNFTKWLAENIEFLNDKLEMQLLVSKFLKWDLVFSKYIKKIVNPKFIP